MAAPGWVERLSAPKHVPHQGPQDDDDGVVKWVAETEAEEDSEVTAQTKKLLGELYTAFVECDEDGNGEMDEREFQGIRDLWLSKVEHGQMTPAQLRHLFLKIDTNCDGGLAWAEVSTALMLFGSDEAEEAGGAAQLVPTVEPPIEPTGAAKYHRDSITSCLYHAPTARWMTTSLDGTFRVWNKNMQVVRTTRPEPRKPQPPKSRRHIGHVPQHPKPPTPIHGGVFCGRDDQWLALLELDRRITFYDVSSCVRIGSVGGSPKTDRMVCVPALDAPSSVCRGYDMHKRATHGCGAVYDPDADTKPSEAARERLVQEMHAQDFAALQERAHDAGLAKHKMERECGFRTDRSGRLSFEVDEHTAKEKLTKQILSVELLPSVTAQGAPITQGKPFEDLPSTWHCLSCGAGRDRFEKEVVDAPLCCTSWRGPKGTNFLAVGDAGGGLSIYKLRHIDEEEEAGEGTHRPGLLAGIDISGEASMAAGSARDPLRVELFYRLREAPGADWITAVKQLPDQNVLAYSSRDGTLRLLSLTRLEEEIPSLQKKETLGTPSLDGVGIRAFDWSPTYRWFATCGPSRAVKLWSTHDTSAPVKVLDGHGAVTIGVQMVDRRQHIITLAVDRVVKIWDMRSLVSVQTINLDPATLFEHNVPTMLFCNTGVGDGCLVAGCTRLARWDPAVGDTPAAALLDPNDVRHSHRAPCVSVRYIPDLEQLVSMDRGGRMKVWDAPSAEMLFACNGDHQSRSDGRMTPISAFAVDEGRRRAISAAEDGTICVWNPNAGHLLHSFLPPQQATRGRATALAGSVFRSNASQAGATSKSLEVRSVLYWAEMEHFVAVGWSRSLMCYADKPSFGQAQLPDWNESRHRADVMCTALSHPYLVTGSLDGTLVIWRATSQRQLLASKRLCTVRREVPYKEYGLPHGGGKAVAEIVGDAVSEELAVECATFGLLAATAQDSGNMSNRLLMQARKATQREKVLVTGHGDGCVRLWCTQRWQVKVWWHATEKDDEIRNGVAPTGLPHALNHIAMDPQGEVVYTASAGAITAWSVAQLRMPTTKMQWVRGDGVGCGVEIVPVQLARWRVTAGSPLSGFTLLGCGRYVVTADEAGDVVLWTCTGERVGVYGVEQWDLAKRQPPTWRVAHKPPPLGNSVQERAAAVVIQAFQRTRSDLLKKQRKSPGRTEQGSRPPTAGTAVSFDDRPTTADSVSVGERPVTPGSERPGTSGSSVSYRSAAVTPVRDPSVTPEQAADPFPPKPSPPSPPSPPQADLSHMPRSAPLPDALQHMPPSPTPGFGHTPSPPPKRGALHRSASVSTAIAHRPKLRPSGSLYSSAMRPPTEAIEVAPAARLASVRALQTERSLTKGRTLMDLHERPETDRLHRAMASARVSLRRPPPRPASPRSAGIDRYQLCPTPEQPEVHMKTMISLGTERRNEIVKDLYNPRLTAGIHEQAIMARSPRGTRPHSSLQ